MTAPRYISRIRYLAALVGCFTVGGAGNLSALPAKCQYTSFEITIPNTLPGTCEVSGISDAGDVVGACMWELYQPWVPFRYAAGTTTLYHDLTLRNGVMLSNEMLVTNVTKDGTFAVVTMYDIFLVDRVGVRHVLDWTKAIGGPMLSRFEARINDDQTVLIKREGDDSGLLILYFIRPDGTFTVDETFTYRGRYKIPGTINLPVRPFQLTGFNTAGTVLGNLVMHEYRHGFSFRDRTWRIIKGSGLKAVQPLSINNKGNMAGSVADIQWQTLPAVWLNGERKQLPLPYSAAARSKSRWKAEAIAINDKDQVVVEGGDYSKNPSKTGGLFLFDQGTYCPVYEPVKTSTSWRDVNVTFRGLNNCGDVVVEVRPYPPTASGGGKRVLVFQRTMGC